MNDEPIALTDSMSKVVRSLRGPQRATGRAAGAGPDPSAAVPGSGSVSPASLAATLGGVFGRWDELVGTAVARHVQPVKLDGDRLVVEVDDPAWATQLRFLERDLLARLGEATGAMISSFEVRVGRPR